MTPRSGGSNSWQQGHPWERPPFDCRVETQGDQITVYLDGEEVRLTVAQLSGGEGWCRTEDGKKHRFAAAWAGDELHLWLDGEVFVFRRPAGQRARRREAAATGGEVLAPMPGTVLEVLVQPGDTVERGQRAMVLESMKMELVVTAPADGVVKRVPVEPGSRVDRGMRLLEVEPGPGEAEGG